MHLPSRIYRVREDAHGLRSVEVSAELLYLPQAQIEQTLKDLQTDYLDLYCIHWPVAMSTQLDQVSSGLVE